MSEETKNDQVVADVTWDFGGSKGAVHMDGDYDSMRNLTVDVTGANPENAMTVRVEFKGDLFMQIMDVLGTIVDAASPLIAKAFLGKSTAKKETVDVPPPFSSEATAAYAASEGNEEPEPQEIEPKEA